LLFLLDMELKIKPGSVNFTELIQSCSLTRELSTNFQSELIEQLIQEFTEEEQQWYLYRLRR
jgi:hypothetical protein